MVRLLSENFFKIIFSTVMFFIFALSIFPQPLIYAADVTLAWYPNLESDLAGYYIYYKTGASGAPYNGTVATEGNSPIKVHLAILSDPANPEFTIHGLSDTETSYFVLTAFDIDDIESSFSNEVSYEPSSAPTLISLYINGEDSVVENNSSNYTATATFSDGSTQTVTSNSSWSEDSPYASINSSGVVNVSEVSGDVTITIQASYTIGGITKTATKIVTIIDVPALNLPPSTPSIVYPGNGQYDVEAPLDITTGSFSDPNGDFHSQSQWQISDQNDFSSLVLDVTSNNYLTVFSVPHMALKANQKYYVRTRFYDAYLTASSWSAPVEFTTTIFFDDLNSNGIPDADEVDDTVDFNLDGISDNDQPQIIKCVQTSDHSAYVGIEITSSSVSEIETLEVIDPETISDTFNRPDDIIFGVICYRLRVNQPGSTATLRVHFSGEIFPSDTFFKYDTINGWYDYSAHTTYNHDGQSVTLEVKDGGYGDSDGLANGIIVDPAGIASGGSTNSGGGGSSGGSSGCFIATAAFGSKFEEHVQLLRRFRNLYLMPYKIGCVFVNAYYRYSPPAADFIADHNILRVMVRWSLLPLVGLSWMLLHLGTSQTLMLLLVMGSTVLICYRRIRLRYLRLRKK